MQTHTPIRAALRGPQIIRLLNTHGPLNAAAIEALLDLPIARRRLNDALSRLIQRGIVVKRFQNLFQTSHDQYYQLSARKECQAEIGDVIGMDPNIFRIPRVRNQDLYHSIGCAHLAESLRKNFPMAEVVREFNLLEHPVGKTTHLSSLEGENQILPDMLLTFPEDEKRRASRSRFRTHEVYRARNAHRPSGVDETVTGVALGLACVPPEVALDWRFLLVVPRWEPTMIRFGTK